LTVFPFFRKVHIHSFIQNPRWGTFIGFKK
jgi:hypothetical protein